MSISITCSFSLQSEVKNISHLLICTLFILLLRFSICRPRFFSLLLSESREEENELQYLNSFETTLYIVEHYYFKTDLSKSATILSDGIVATLFLVFFPLPSNAFRNLKTRTSEDTLVSKTISRANGQIKRFL